MNNEEKILTMLEGLSNSVEGLSGTVAKQGEVLDKLNGKVNRLETDVAKLRKGQNKLEKMIMKTKKSTVLIENKHGKKIRALFDAQCHIHDIAKNVLSSFNRIEAKLDRHDIEIMDLNLKYARASWATRAKKIEESEPCDPNG